MPKKAASPRAWQRMLSGRRLDLLDPSPLDIEIEDIAHGLARVARWNGQTVGPHAFSVAQHTLAVEEIAGILTPDIGAVGGLAAMLHDAPEYVLGDLISPFKALLGGEYPLVERRLLAAIHLRFGLPSPLTAVLTAKIKTADHISAYFEAVALAGFGEAEAAKIFGRPHGIEPGRIDFTPWPAAKAERRFLQRFKVLAAAADKA